jgi:hypothetical protein
MLTIRGIEKINFIGEGGWNGSGMYIRLSNGLWKNSKWIESYIIEVWESGGISMWLVINREPTESKSRQRAYWATETGVGKIIDGMEFVLERKALETPKSMREFMLAGYRTMKVNYKLGKTI